MPYANRIPRPTWLVQGATAAAALQKVSHKLSLGFPAGEAVCETTHALPQCSRACRSGHRRLSLLLQHTQADHGHPAAIEQTLTSCPDTCGSVPSAQF